MQLPLEYQGFCPWTMVNRHGLLLPGKPAIGVVRYRNMYYVFAHAVALEAFMAKPETIRAGVLRLAAASPELIHLLRLQDNFPNTSIAALLRSDLRPSFRHPYPSSTGRSHHGALTLAA